MMMNYNVIAHYDNTTVTCETDDINIVLTFFVEHKDTQLEVIDGSTGEVLCTRNCENPILKDDFGLILLSFVMKRVQDAATKKAGEEG